MANSPFVLKRLQLTCKIFVKMAVNRSEKTILNRKGAEVAKTKEEFESPRRRLEYNVGHREKNNIRSYAVGFTNKGFKPLVQAQVMGQLRKSYNIFSKTLSKLMFIYC